MTKTTWEYGLHVPRYEHGWTKPELNELGAQGWELAAVIPADKSNPDRLIFKRPAADQPEPAVAPGTEDAPYRQRLAAERAIDALGDGAELTAENMGGVVNAVMANAPEPMTVAHVENVLEAAARIRDRQDQGRSHFYGLRGQEIQRAEAVWLLATGQITIQQLFP